MRVRARPEQFDERKAILLPSRERHRMVTCLGEDIPRMDELRSQYRAATGWQAPAVQSKVLNSEEYLDRHQTSASASPSSVNTTTSYADSALSKESEDSVDALTEIFAGPNHDLGVIPLVDLWLDLAKNLKQEDIPNPLDFLKERDAVVSIIQAAHEHAYTALNAPPPKTAPRPGAALAQQHEAEAGEVKTKVSTRTPLRMPKLLRKWSSGLKALTNRIRGF